MDYIIHIKYLNKELSYTNYMAENFEIIDVGSENNEAPKEVEEIKEEEPINNEESKEVEPNNIINEEDNKVEEEPKRELNLKRTQRKRWSVQSVTIFNKIHFTQEYFNEIQRLEGEK